MPKYFNAVLFTSSTSGTANFGIGAAVTGYQTPAAAGVVNGDLVSYRAESANLTQWQEGTASYNTTGPVLTRLTVTSNNLGTTAEINFTNPPNIGFVQAAADITAQLVGSNNLSDVSSATTARTNIGAIGYGMVNKFVNGPMDVWQLGTSAIASAATTVNGYANDGWMINATYSSGAGPVMSQVANPRTGARTQWALKILGATGITDVILKQRIEGAISADFGTQTVTVQAQIYNTSGGSITPTLTVKYPTATDNYGATTTDGTVSAVSLQACANATTTQVAYTFTPSGTVALGMEVSIDLGNNFSANTKYVYVTECDIRATPSATTGLNASPPAPELRPVAQETILCQRYYNFITQSGGTYTPIGWGGGNFYNDANQIGYMANLGFIAPKMRTSPTIAFSGTQGTDFGVVTAAGVIQSGFTFAFTIYGALTATKTAHGLTPNATSVELTTTSGKLTLDARL